MALLGWARRVRGGIPLLLAAATLLAHGGDLNNGFVWDDHGIIVNNPATRDLGRLGEVLLSPDETPPYYRPLNRASYLLDYQLWGMDPRGFHAVNVALHLACVLLLYALARRLFVARWPAVVAALLLAVHPVNVEAVGCVTCRNNLFALLFVLATCILLDRAIARHSPLFSVLSGCALFLGLASKEQAAMALPWLVVWVFRAPESRPRRARGLYLLAPHVVALAAYLSLRTVALGGAVATDPILPGLGARLLRNYYVLPAYARLLVFPDQLSHVHEVPADYLSLAWLPFAWLAILAAAAFAVWRLSRVSALGLLWCLMFLVPVLGFFPIPSAAHSVLSERFLYVPAVGLWLVVADAVRTLSRHRRYALGATAVLLGALAVRAQARTAEWHDDRTLVESAVRWAPDSAIGRLHRGTALRERGDLEGARREWEAALAIYPADVGIRTQLGTLAAVQGRWRDAEVAYRMALQEDPEFVEAEFNLARICERTGRWGEAIALYRASLKGSSYTDVDVGALAAAALQRLGAATEFR